MVDYFTGILTNVTIFGVIALGLDIQWGWAGLVNLSYVTFVAAGAYGYAVTTSAPAAANGSTGTYILGLQWPFLAGVAAGMVLAVALAAVIGAIALKRVRPEYFAIVTLAVGLVLFQLVSQLYGLFNGQEGMYAIPNPVSDVTWAGTLIYPQVFLLICLVFVAGAVVLDRYIHDSPFGRAVRATRDAEDAAEAFGYDTFGLKLRAFVLGAAFAGVGGALLVAYLTAYGTGAWTPSETFLLFVMVLVGGKGRALGVLLGVVLLTGVLQEATRFLPSIPGHPDAEAAIRLVIIGALILASLWWRPQGLLPEARPRDRMSGARPRAGTDALTGGEPLAGSSEGLRGA